MDVEAEMAYVDILRTLQNSILNSDTNVSCPGSVQLTGDVAVAVIMTPPQPRLLYIFTSILLPPEPSYASHGW